MYFVESRVKVQGPELTVKAEKEIVHFMDNRVVAMLPHGGVYPTINLGPAEVHRPATFCLGDQPGVERGGTRDDGRG